MVVFFLIRWSRGELTGKFQTSSSDANNEARKFPRDSHSIQDQGGAETGGKCWMRYTGEGSQDSHRAQHEHNRAPQQRPPSLSRQQLGKPRGSDGPWQQARGQPVSPFLDYGGKTPKPERKANKRTQGHASLKTSWGICWPGVWGGEGDGEHWGQTHQGKTQKQRGITEMDTDH